MGDKSDNVSVFKPMQTTKVQCTQPHHATLANTDHVSI